MNKQKGGSVIGIIAAIAIAILAGMYIQAKTDIMNYETDDLITNLESQPISNKTMDDDAMMMADDKMEKSDDAMMMGDDKMEKQS